MATDKEFDEAVAEVKAHSESKHTPDVDDIPCFCGVPIKGTCTACNNAFSQGVLSGQNMGRDKTLRHIAKWCADQLGEPAEPT